MRSNEERVAAVKERSMDLELKSKKRQRRVIRFSSFVVCLVLIIGLSLAMPRIINNSTNNSSNYSSLTASVFSYNSGMGYIAIGLLAFALGICVTVLCYKIQHFGHEEKDKKTDQGNKYD